jgi:hypothetical protein
MFILTAVVLDSHNIQQNATMTKTLEGEDLARRYIYNPRPGVAHIYDIINRVKDGIYAKDKISDHVIGMLLFAVFIGVIEPWEAALFQVPFVFKIKTTLQLRVNRKHLGLVPVGRPFLGPDGRVISRDGRAFCGFAIDLELSQLSFAQIKTQPDYKRWLKDTLYAGGDAYSNIYNRTSDRNSKSKCDNYVNERNYTPGPTSIRPDVFRQRGLVVDGKPKIL